jgi:hypothetical protein
VKKYLESLLGPFNRAAHPSDDQMKRWKKTMKATNMYKK